jgi:hypothetical protein
MTNQPTLGQLAKTAGRLQRQSLASAMFGRGSHTQPTPAVQEFKRAPPPGTVVTGMSATRIVRQRPGLAGDYGEAAGKDKASDTSDGGQQAIGDNDGR